MDDKALIKSTEQAAWVMGLLGVLIAVASIIVPVLIYVHLHSTVTVTVPESELLISGGVAGIIIAVVTISAAQGLLAISAILRDVSTTPMGTQSPK